MKSQRREISFFNLSFLDTFCCALGAMILMFVLNNQTLTNYVKQSMQKYKEKAEEAEREKTRVIEQRNAAQIARDRASEAEKSALKARDLAEKAQTEAEKNQKAAIVSQKEAEEQRNRAEKAAQESILSRQQLEIALAQARESQKQLEKTRQELEQKNLNQEKINETLREMIRENKTQDEKIKEMVQRYQNVQDAYKELEEKKRKMEEDILDSKAQKERLQKERDRLEQEYKEAQEKIEAIKQRYEGALTQNDRLSSNLREKQEELRRRERELADREREIKNRETDIVAKEREIAKLQKIVETKQDKSLFGIQLTYRRILFLIDRSGSIIQNNWKQVVIGTAKELLQHCEVDEFAIIAFSSEMLFYPPRRGLVASGDSQNKNDAIEWLGKRVLFGGTTHLHEALAIGYEEYGPSDAIFILTDGLPSARNRTTQDLQREILSYIKKKKDQNVNTKIITIAIGYPPDANEYMYIYKFLHQICEMTGGQYLGR